MAKNEHIKYTNPNHEKFKSTDSLSPESSLFQERILQLPDFDLAEDDTDRLSELTAYLEKITENISDKEVSPQFNEDGGFRAGNEIKSAFIALLHSLDYPAPAIYSFIDEEMAGPLKIIAHTGKQIFETRESVTKIEHPDNPFAALDVDEEKKQTNVEELKNTIKELETKRSRQTAALFTLLKDALQHPEHHNLTGKESLKPSKSVDVFTQELATDTPEQAFYSDGKLMRVNEKLQLCQGAIVQKLSPKKNKEAYNLLLDECISPAVKEEYGIIHDDSLEKDDKLQLQSEHTVRLAKLMAYLLNSEGIKTYGQLIYDGSLPPDVELEDLPFDLPKLYLRDPYELKKQIKDLRGEKKAMARYDYWYKERYAELGNEEIDEMIDSVRTVDKKEAQHFFQDQLGYMPQPTRLAMIHAMFSRFFNEADDDNYDESEFADFHERVTNDLFTQEGELIRQIEALDSAEEGYDQQVRGLERRIAQLHEKLVIELKEWLDPQSAIMKRMEVAGASEGQLRLTFAK